MFIGLCRSSCTTLFVYHTSGNSFILYWYKQETYYFLAQYSHSFYGVWDKMRRTGLGRSCFDTLLLVVSMPSSGHFSSVYNKTCPARTSFEAASCSRGSASATHRHRRDGYRIAEITLINVEKLYRCRLRGIAENSQRFYRLV